MAGDHTLNTQRKQIFKYLFIRDTPSMPSIGQDEGDLRSYLNTYAQNRWVIVTKTALKSTIS